jgi:hypothetical protein
MARFLTPDAFEAPEKHLELLPFRFERRAGNYLVSNMVGDFVTLADDEFHRLAELRISPGDGLYEKAYAGHLITRQGQHAQHQLLALRLRSRHSAASTQSLHEPSQEGGVHPREFFRSFQDDVDPGLMGATIDRLGRIRAAVFIDFVL